MEDNNTPSLEDLIYFDDENESSPDLGDSMDPTASGPNPDNEPETEPEDTVEQDSQDLLKASSEQNLNDQEEEEETPTVEEEPEEEPEDLDLDDEEGSGGEYSAYFEFLKENNLLILPEDFEFDGSAEGFEKAVETSRNQMEVAGAQMIWDKLPEDFKLVLDYALKGGNDLGRVVETINKKIDLTDADLEDEDIQERVMQEFYRRNTQYGNDDIDKYIRLLRKSGDLEEEASNAYKRLQKDFESEKKQLVEEEAKRRQEYENTVRESYTKFNNVVDSMANIPETKRKKIVQSIWGNNTYGPDKNMTYFNYVDQSIKSNPEHLAQLTSLYLDYDPEKGFNSDAIIKKAESKVNSKFRDKLEKLTSTKPSRGSKPKKVTKKSKKQSVEALEAFLRQN